MSEGTFMDKLRSFFGIRREPPRNDFRNPIWGSDDEDDGDELYSRNQMEVFSEALDMHQEFSRQMQEMFRSFGNMFDDMSSFFQDDHFNHFSTFSQADPPLEGDTYSGSSKSLRDHYLKPGYYNRRDEPQEDIDLDGKISSNDISGLLKQKDDSPTQIVPFNGNMVPGRSFCQTIITTSVTKPDGTIETKRIVKNGNEVIEETTTTSPDTRGPVLSGDTIMGNSFVYNNILPDLSSLFRNFY